MPQQSVSLLVAVDVCPLFANQFVCYSSLFVFFFFLFAVFSTSTLLYRMVNILFLFLPEGNPEHGCGSSDHFSFF